MALILAPARNDREKEAINQLRLYEATNTFNTVTIRTSWVRFALSRIAAADASRDVILCATGLALRALGITSKSTQYAVLVQVSCQPLDRRSRNWEINLAQLTEATAALHARATTVLNSTAEQLDSLLRSTDPTRTLPVGDERKLTLDDYHAVRAAYRRLLDILGLP